MKQTVKTGIIAVMIAVLSAHSLSAEQTGASASSTVDASAFAKSVAKTASTWNASDVAENTKFSYAITIDLNANTAKLGTNAAVAIGETATTIVTSDNTGVTVAKAANGILTITSTLASPVKYSVSGTLSGTLVISSAAESELVLNGAKITAKSGPAIKIAKATKTFIVLADGTTSTLADSTTRTDTSKAALYSKGSIVFSGTGSLLVTGSYKNGIYSDDYIRIAGGTIQIDVSAKNAIQTVNAFIFDDGNLTINATGTTQDDESKGIKVDGADITGAGKGYVVINGGKIAIKSVSKGITAGWDIDEDTKDKDSTNNPTPYLVINNGIISVTTTGTPYEKTLADGTAVSCSPEGIEAKSDLTINNGYLTIKTADDCVNAGTSITINGGYLYAMSSANDAIDSNGTLTINGGFIVAGGAAIPEGSYDCDQNTFKITGGTFVGVAGDSSLPTANACTQNSVRLGEGTAGTTLAVKSSDGTIAFAFTIPQSYTTMILSSPSIKTGTAYTVYTGGTAKGESNFFGLYLGKLSYTGGTAGTEFTVSSAFTNTGGSTGGPGAPGGPGGFGGPSGPGDPNRLGGPGGPKGLGRPDGPAVKDGTVNLDGQKIQ